jgi:hypothetical protein
LLLSASVAFGATTFANSANATSMLIFDLDVDSCTGTCGPPGTLFGTVTLTEVDTDTIHVDVDLSQDLLSYFINTGAGYSLTWNGPDGEVVSNMSPATGFTVLPWLDTSSNGGYDTGGNFGKFNYAILCEVAPNKAPNPQGFFFSVDLIGPNGNTGVIGAKSFTECTEGAPGCVPQECPPTAPECTPPTVPEPGTLALIGISLLSGVALRRSRQRMN